METMARDAEGSDLYKQQHEKKDRLGNRSIWVQSLRKVQLGIGSFYIIQNH